MRKTLLWFVLPALMSAPAFASPASKWVPITDNAAVDVLALRPAGADISVPVLRNYEKVVVLGHHVPSDTPMYPHRSARIEYVVSCASGRIAMRSWQLFSERNAGGEIVWADRNFGAIHARNPQTDEEQGTVATACGKSIAGR
jgi:hypothetical protein